MAVNVSSESIQSNLIYCFAGTISSPQRGTQCAELTKIIIIRRIEIQNCGCDKEERKLNWKTGIKEVGFEVFPKDATEGLFLI